MVRLAKSSRGIPTSSASMDLDTSSATMMSTPSVSTSSIRVPHFGSIMPMASRASAVLQTRNFQTCLRGRASGQSDALNSRSTASAIRFCFQR